MKYGEWLDEWLKYSVKHRVKDSTYRKYKRQAERYLLPSFGEREMEDIDALALQRFVADLSERGLAPGTVNGIITTLKNTLRTAVIEGVATEHHADRIRRPPMRERQVICFEKTEQEKIERYVRTRLHGRANLYGVLLDLYTGLRIGELLALRWADVDLRARTLTVSRTCRDSWENGQYRKITDTPKTAASARVIPIPRQLMPVLYYLWRKRNSEYVVMGKTAHGAQIRSYQRTFELMLKSLHIPHRGFHALRHTFATRALECGMDVKTLSDILGHQNPTVTLKRYTHALYEHKAEMMNRLGKLLRWE